MTRRRVKQYLTLLTVAGVLAVAESGGGSFATFTAEAANPGNTFKTGTLILNDNGGTNTCTSAVNTSNSNSAGTDCDTLFNVSKFSFSTGAIGGSSLTVNSGSGSSYSMPVTGFTGPVYVGDKLTLDNGTNTETVTAKSYLASGSGNITVDTTGLAHAYSTGDTVTNGTPTEFAKLKLTNAGTLDASGISFKASAACTDSYAEPSTTLNMTATKGGSVSVLTVATYSGSFSAGDPVVVSDGTNAQTFIATGSGDTTTTIHVQSDTWNFAFASGTGTKVSGPQFNGSTAKTLCSDLTLTITETDSSMNTDLSGAQGCAYRGSASNTNPATTNSCTLAQGTTLNSLPTTLTSLTLKSGYNSNTGTDLTHSQSRYFVLAVHYTGSSFDNTYQNWKSSSFNLLWHITQS